MKNIKNMITLFLAGCFALALVSCNKDKDSEDIGKVTTFPTLKLNGDASIILPKGTAFVDPGYTALEGTMDINDRVSVTGSVDVNACGLYTLTYKVSNSQGFGIATATRMVAVHDATQTVDYSGDYTLTVTTGSYGPNEPAQTISKEAEENGLKNVFKMSSTWEYSNTGVPVRFAYLGDGKFYVFPQSSPWGNFDATVSSLTYDEGSQTFTYKGGFTTQNPGITWTATWKKK